jgi:hypothetical protein
VSEANETRDLFRDVDAGLALKRCVNITELIPALRSAKSVDPSRTTLAPDQKMRRFGRDDSWS